MTGEELKSSVLKYAIQGKLVEQREDEGTAEELYQQIISEKQKLIKEGKIKKSKSLPEISENEVPFEIPDTWKWLRHNQIFEIIGGSQPPKSFFVDKPKLGYIRLYQIRDYGKKPMPVYVPESKVSKLTKKDDILLARYGASIGKVFRAEEGAYNVALARVKKLFDSNLINSDYLFIFYESDLYQTLVKFNSRSAQAGFNKSDLNNLLFPLPPLREQERIVERVKEINLLVANYSNEYKQLKRLNQDFAATIDKSILKYAIQGKLVEQREDEGTAEELYQQIISEKQKLIKEGKIKKSKSLPEISENEVPFEIPDTWKWVRHNQIFEIIGGSQPPKSFFVDKPKLGYIRLYQIRDYGKKPMPVYVPESKVSKLTKKDDILLARYGASIGKVFRAEEGAYNVALARVKKLFDSNLINSDYLFIFYESDLYQTLVKFNSRSAQAGFNKSDLNNLLFPLPPLREQERIVEEVDKLRLLTDKLKKEIEVGY